MKYILLILILAVVGCGSDNTAEETPQVWANNLASIVPSISREVLFIDLSAMRSDEDFENEYNEGKLSFSGIVEPFKIDYEDICTIAVCDNLVLFEGSFDSSQLLNLIKTKANESYQYIGLEIWNLAPAYATVIDGVLLVEFGSADRIENCISVHQGKRKSLYEYDKLSNLRKLLPDGFMLTYESGTIAEQIFIGNIIISAISVSKNDNQSLLYTGICLIREEDNAFTVDNLRDKLGHSGWQIKSITQEGNIITIIGNVPISDTVVIDGSRLSNSA